MTNAEFNDMRYINRIIRRFKGAVAPPYGVYPITEDLRGKTFENIGKVPWTREEMRQSLKEFARLYSKRPIRDNQGGMNSPHMFYCWFTARRLSPEVIIESGVWKGQSTWLFENAVPEAKLISIDPRPELRKYISKKVDYRTADFSENNWDGLPKHKTLCFFDDHYGVDRIWQCRKFGFKHVLYEDNYPAPGGNTNNPSGNAMSPKAALYEGGTGTSSLRDILETYYEFPPVYPNVEGPRYMWKDYKSLTPEPLIMDVEDKELLVYKREAWGYTWLCYVELKT
jgi:hypothetical protein